MIDKINVSISGDPFTVGDKPPYYKYPTEYPVPSSLFCEVFEVDKIFLMEFQKRLLKELEERVGVICRGEIFSRPSSQDYPLYLRPGLLFKTSS